MAKLNSLEQLREYTGLKSNKNRKEKPVTCRKCGAEMSKVAGNVWVCNKKLTNKEGKVITDKKGEPKTCGNTYIRHNYSN